ncbi:hypothetical protein Ndes2526A_g01054 [Nannochloris sp. 'desiccata']|nr:hypothetical protein KSW81_002112 [Chlorella desiccata (nom. nud.)]
MGRLRTIESIYEDFLKRREGLINALTDDSEDFLKACDPNRDNLCLYGNSDGTWEVDLPAAEVPPELPEPVLGINFARDGMEQKDWLALCAVHSDAWLMSVLFFYAARFDDAGRAELFSLVNQHPTVYEVATGRVSRNTMFKHRHPAGGRSPAGGPAVYGNGGASPGQPQQQFFFQGPVSSTTPAASGRLLVESDVTPALRGRQAELYWPDDGKWYLVAIQALDLRTSKAKVQYATGEEETLDLAEVIRENQMNLLL